jgi:signal transduction histidine kinase
MFDPMPGTLFAEPNPSLDAITSAAALSIKAPLALLTVLTAAEQRFLCAAGAQSEAWRGRSTPLRQSVCRHVANAGTVLAIGDMRRHPVFRNHDACDALGVAAYLGAPVRIGPNGDAAVLCLIDARPRRWSGAACQLLEVLAAAASAHLALQAARSERDHLFRTLSHEIRTPLNGVMGGMALYDGARDADQQARCLGMVRESAKRLLDVADALLEQMAARPAFDEGPGARSRHGAS